MKIYKPRTIHIDSVQNMANNIEIKKLIHVNRRKQTTEIAIDVEELAERGYKAIDILPYIERILEEDIAKMFMPRCIDSIIKMTQERIVIKYYRAGDWYEKLYKKEDVLVHEVKEVYTHEGQGTPQDIPIIKGVVVYTKRICYKDITTYIDPLIEDIIPIIKQTLENITIRKQSKTR
jgi:hypothetical protein